MENSGNAIAEFCSLDSRNRGIAPVCRGGLPALMRQTRKDKGYEGKGHRVITGSGSRGIDIYIFVLPIYIDGGGRIERRRYEKGDREDHV